MEFNFNPQPECCKYCSNNPLNNPYASGTCCCSLPYQTTTNIIYESKPTLSTPIIYSGSMPKIFL